jgi:hypothetical protein
MAGIAMNADGADHHAGNALANLSRRLHQYFVDFQRRKATSGRVIQSGGTDGAQEGGA